MIDNKKDAREFLNYSAPKFIKQSPSAMEKLKSHISDNNGAYGAAAIGGVLGGLGIEAITDASNESNIGDLNINLKEIESNKVDYESQNINQYNNDEEHHTYTTNKINTNKDITGVLDRINNTVTTEDNVGDVKNSKEVLADEIFKKQEDGKSIHDTLSPTVQKELKNSSVVPGFSDGKMWHDSGNQHEDIANDIENIGDRRETAVEQHLDTKDNPEVVAKANQEYIDKQENDFINQQDNLRQDNKELQNSIINYNNGTFGKTLAGIGTGASLAYGGKKMYENKQANAIDNIDGALNTEIVPNQDSQDRQDQTFIPRYTNENIVPSSPLSPLSTYVQPPVSYSPHEIHSRRDLPIQHGDTLIKGWKSPINNGTPGLLK